ncbi:MAG TPA: hypothetical protein VGJ44_12055, partial [Kribbellaceae bacterium]
MQRHLGHVVCAVALAGLVAGCSGGDDKADSGSSAGATASDGAGASPTSPALTPYDPPNAFLTVNAVRLERDKDNSTFDAKVGMFEDTALWADLFGLHAIKVGSKDGWDLPADGSPLRRTGPSVSPTDSETASESAGGTETPSGPGFKVLDVTAPVPVKLAGRDVVAVAFSQRVLGGGTTKDHFQVRFEWVD